MQESREKQAILGQKQLEEAKSEISRRDAQLQAMTKRYKEALSIIESLRLARGQTQEDEMKKMQLTVAQYEKEMNRLRGEHAQLVRDAESECRRGV